MLHSADIASDEAEIEAAIISDLDSYLSRNKAKWETHWVQDERLMSIVDCGPRIVSRGFVEFRRNLFRAMDSSDMPSMPQVRRENLAIHVRDDVAWAHFDQLVFESDDPILPPSFTYNMRVFERHPDGWKVVFHGVWSLPGREMRNPAIEVDPRSRVIWMNAAAEERLKTFPALRISHGKLRTAKPALQSQLQEALSRAGDLLDYVRFRDAESDPDQDISFPVLLGEEEDGSLLICRVLVAGSRIYVCFGDEARLARSIKRAAIVFGLSDAQHSLAERVANGLSLEQSATEMGITVNTARTHLRRMYDKTGARNQAALLRIFLAMG